MHRESEGFLKETVKITQFIKESWSKNFKLKREKSMVPQQYTIPQSSITPSSTNYNQTHADEEDSRVEDSNCTCSLNAIMKRKSNCNNYLQIQ